VRWSRYNHLFASERFGRHLYNALSNSLMEVDEAHYRALLETRERGGVDAAAAPPVEAEFVALLRENKALVEAGEEDALLLVRRYERLAACFDASRLRLSICPTLACNFRCPYCFEHTQQDTAVMSAETVDRLVAYIVSREDARHLSLTWFGGEPTLAWDVIEDVTARLHDLDIDVRNAGLVTNGYLLGAARIARLDDLRIGSVQVTLDGPREVHDRRRFLAGGGPTYARILENVTALMDSSYSGSCAIRVNVDRENVARSLDLQAELMQRFAGKKVRVYAAHVETGPGGACDRACSLDLASWAAFVIDLYHQGGPLPHGGFFPSGALPGVCVATCRSDLVVGPRGELYKCWEDVGKPHMVVGDLHAAEPVTDPGLQALYTLGADPFSDPECLACAALPICGGGCANRRLRLRHFGEDGVTVCTPYKDHLTAYLEAYLDTVRRREICTSVLSPGTTGRALSATPSGGYRMVSPRERRAAPGAAAAADTTPMSSHAPAQEPCPPTPTPRPSPTALPG
jgi:uncharacterized protein